MNIAGLDNLRNHLHWAYASQHADRCVSLSPDGLASAAVSGASRDYAMDLRKVPILEKLA